MDDPLIEPDSASGLSSPVRKGEASDVALTFNDHARSR